MNVLSCPNCGANVPHPADPNATLATCGHCHFTVPLTLEWVKARQQQQAAIDQRLHAQRLREVGVRAQRNKRLIWSLGTGGVFVVIVGIVLFSVGSELWSQQEKRDAAEVEAARVDALGKQRKDELAPLLNQMNQRGCTREVESVQAHAGPYKSQLKMNAGGNCLHVLVASDGSIALNVSAPSGKLTEANGQGTLDFEHCPSESGDHVFNLSNPEGRVVAHAMLDCPPAFEKNKGDPNRNGLAAAQERLSILEKQGCKRVILPAQPVTGERSLTATMEPGPFCTVLVATAGSEQNVLAASMKTPMGEGVAAPPPAKEVELAYCAKVAGEHAVVVSPKNMDYFTLAAMECPKAVAKKHGAR